MALPPAAAETMARVVEELADARDAWWLLGGTAVALHGLAIDIADVDVLVSVADVRRLMSKLGLAAQPATPVDRIRSEVWLSWTGLPLGVDFMAGLEVRAGDRWQRISPTTREAVRAGDSLLYVPVRSELIDILRQFGRPKDLQRADGLAQLA
jgi:hypothetical protein